MPKKGKISDILWVLLSFLGGLLLVYVLYLLVHYWERSSLSQQIFS